MAAVANPMDYYILPLTKEEHKLGAVAHGYKFVKENESRWILVNDSNYELQTYDRGYTQIVYQGKVYVIHKDYIIIDENRRVFILSTLDAEVDRIKEVVDNNTDNSTDTESSENENNEDNAEESAETTTEDTKVE